LVVGARADHVAVGIEDVVQVRAATTARVAATAAAVTTVVVAEVVASLSGTAGYEEYCEDEK
jgi:hypothetical protein